MVVTPEISPEVISTVTNQNVEAINAYIESKQTATWFFDDGTGRHNREVITAELIYYWMVAFSIPFECQYWHLNRLLTLIRVCNVKNSKPKKMSMDEIAERNRRLNKQRKKDMNTNG